MDAKIKSKIRRLTDNQLEVLSDIVSSGVTSSNATVARMELNDPVVTGVYGSLSRAELIMPHGKLQNGRLRWELHEDLQKNKEEIKTLLDILTE